MTTVATMDDMEANERQVAERQVDAFLHVLRTRYGLKEDDIPELLDNMKWVVKHRKTIDKGGTYAIFTLLALVVSGLAMALWEGIKHKLGVAQ